MVVMLLTVILITTIIIPSPAHSFVPSLNLPFPQILPTAAFLSFSRIDYMDSPDCLPILLSTSVFLLFSLFSVVHFLVVGSVR